MHLIPLRNDHRSLTRMNGLLSIAEQTDSSKGLALRNVFSGEHTKLIEEECMEVSVYLQTLFPGSALVFPFTALGVLTDTHSKVTPLLAVQSTHLLYRDSDGLCFVSVSSVGNECTSLFDDGSMLLTICTEEDEEEKKHGHRTRQSVKGDIKDCLKQHLRVVGQKRRDGIEPLSCHSLDDFKKHCERDLEGNSALFWQLFIPNWAFFLVILLALYLISLVIIWCAKTIPIVSALILMTLWVLVRWKNKFFHRIDTAMRLERSFLETTIDLSSTRIQSEFSKLKEVLETLGFREHVRVKDLLQESIGISNKYAIFTGDDQRTLAYLTLSRNRTLLQGLVNLFNFHSFSNPQCMVSFQTIFSDYASLNSFESFTDTVTTKTGETLHQHELHVPAGTDVRELHKAHQERMLELIDHTKLDPRTFDSAEAILDELELRARKLKNEWVDAIDDDEKANG